MSELLMQGRARKVEGEEVGQLLPVLRAYLCLQEAGSGAWRVEVKR